MPHVEPGRDHSVAQGGVEVLLSRIERVRGRERVVAVTAGASRTVLAFIGLVVGFFILDWLILSRIVEGPGANRFARGVLVAAMLGTLVYVFMRNILWELTLLRSDDEIALRVEGRHEELHGRLISTVQLTRDIGEGAYVGSEELVRALEEDTVSFASRLNFADIISLRTLKKVGLAAAGFTLLSVATGAYRADYAKALFGRLVLAGTSYPTRTRVLSISPSDVVPRGESYEVDVELDPDGYLPDSATLMVRPLAGGKGYDYRMMKLSAEHKGPEGGVLYRAKIERVMESIFYRARAYDARSTGWERLTVLPRPAIRLMELTYTYPAYTGKPPEQSTVADIQALEGTDVKIVAQLTKPVVTAHLRRRFGTRILDPIAMKLDEGRTLATARVRVTHDGYYRILLRDDDDLENKDPIEHMIDSVPDKAPVVQISFPGRDKTATPFAKWPIRFEARDDFGVARGRLRYRVTAQLEEEPATGTGGGTAPSEQERPRAQDSDEEAPARGFLLKGLVREKGQREVKAEAPFDLKLLGVTPGQRVTYWIEIEDNKIPAPNVGRSRKFEFNIADLDEVLYMLGIVREETLDRIGTILRKEIEAKGGVDEIRKELRGTKGPAVAP